MLKLILLSLILLSPLNPIKIDFGVGTKTEWYVLNDGVMGGRSEGTITKLDESILFEGNVSLANNGGFSSIRGDYQPSDLSDFKKVRVKYRSEGRQFSLQLQNRQAWYLPNYKTILEPTNFEWVTSEIDLLSFDQYQVGRKTGKKVSIEDLKKVIRLGIITEEKKEGKFRFELDYIEFI